MPFPSSRHGSSSSATPPAEPARWRRLGIITLAAAFLAGLILSSRQITSHDIGYHLEYGEQTLDVMDEYRAGRKDPALVEIIREADAARRQRAGAAPEGEVAELPVDEVVRGLRSGPEFGVRYIDHMVSAARASCAEHGIELRLMVAQAKPKPRAAGEPESVA